MGKMTEAEFMKRGAVVQHSRKEIKALGPNHRTRRPVDGLTAIYNPTADIISPGMRVRVWETPKAIKRNFPAIVIRAEGDDVLLKVNDGGTDQHKLRVPIEQIKVAWAV